ncbi:MAG: enoyl-ACP reductase [Candidatus Latescibacterota bacterium]|nr:enoyl-ACP reductase [Candidatus Latescibacterota bacterium]
MLMQDRVSFVAGVANHRSIAWAISRALDREGSQLALGYLGDRELASIEKIVNQLQRPPLLVQCDVSDTDSVAAAFGTVGDEYERLDALVHAIAFAKREDLEGRFADTSRDGFNLALDISAYSLNVLMRAAEPLMKNGGGVVALTYLGSERAVPNYNVMGVAKAALESGIRYLASDLGPSGIRVNGISAGPIKTLAARGIRDFSTMQRTHAERAALKRNVDVEEVADASVFLCSPMSRGITGEILYVDGGYRIMGL